MLEYLDAGATEADEVFAAGITGDHRLLVHFILRPKIRSLDKCENIILHRLIDFDLELSRILHVVHEATHPKDHGYLAVTVSAPS